MNQGQARILHYTRDARFWCLDPFHIAQPHELSGLHLAMKHADEDVPRQHPYYDLPVLAVAVLWLNAYCVIQRV